MKCPSVFNQNEGQTNAHKIKCRVLIVCEGLKQNQIILNRFI